jgi:hypothetical protein
MGLIYDDPQLAAMTLTSIAAEESEGPSAMTGRMREVLDDVVQRNGAPSTWRSWSSSWPAHGSPPSMISPAPPGAAQRSF